MSGAQQLAFDLGHRKAFGRGDFLVSSANAEAVAWIDRWPEWPGQALAIYGPAGCGKTHLAHVFQESAGARFAAADDIKRLEELAGERVLVLDDAAGLAEEPLLHLVNLHRARGGTMLLTAAQAPARWGVGLADLASRLAALPTAEIAPPDDALLAAVLVKQFADRQVAVAPEVIVYLMARLDRSFAAVAAAARALDDAALAAGRALSIPLAREVLGLGQEQAMDQEVNS